MYFDCRDQEVGIVGTAVIDFVVDTDLVLGLLQLDQYCRTRCAISRTRSFTPRRRSRSLVPTSPAMAVILFTGAFVETLAPHSRQLVSLFLGHAKIPRKRL